MIMYNSQGFINVQEIEVVKNGITAVQLYWN